MKVKYRMKKCKLSQDFWRLLLISAQLLLGRRPLYKDLYYNYYYDVARANPTLVAEARPASSVFLSSSTNLNISLIAFPSNKLPTVT